MGKMARKITRALDEYPLWVERLEELEAELKHLQSDDFIAPGVSKIGEIKTNSSLPFSRVEEMAIKRLIKTHELKWQAWELRERINNIQNGLRRIEEEHSRIIRVLHFEKASLQRASRRLGYSVGRLQKGHEVAMERLENVIGFQDPFTLRVY